ncbi:hypothetical protein J7E96_06595 [Streptomyces sp. ISL-96]|uniref:hypothetical protein n=1 Tax=Streptomyces sp. ISL-96 TaxID=2819191 RepID=UPI001BE54BC9|nr:hypothetical protein [Streptomyces sp. ISL-96]MBT2488196.1 hypothetical protein [Streptomyces sp. ISL-96]
MKSEHRTVRLLPWAGPEGKPCYVLGDGAGYVSRVADNTESVQLGMAGDLLSHAADLLADRRATSRQLHYLASRLTESLRDVKRVAESRGGLLRQLMFDEDGGPEAERGHGDS